VTIAFDPIAPPSWDDPYPLYRALRDAAPVHRAEASGFWSVSRYDDVLFVLKHPELFSSRAMFTVLMNGGRDGGPPLSWDFVRFLVRLSLRARLNPFSLPKARNLIAEDPPVHGTLRNVVNRGFTPRRIAAWEPRIRALVDEHLGALRRGERFDLVHDFAIPLPVTVIAEMLGVEPERQRDFKRWSDAVIEGTTGAGRAQPFSPSFVDAILELMGYLRTMIERRRRRPGDDLISTILADAPGGTPLSPAEAVLFVQLLLVAGNETTTNLIGNAAQALLDHPEQLARVQGDPALVPALVEEALRFDSPVQTVFRTATQDVALAGTTIPQGATVAVLIGAANRDERRFPDPDAFDVSRDARGHLAFGFGEHFCLGSALARLEARVALEALVPELARCERAGGARELLDSFLVRGPRRLELRAAA
jgi:cytochrome P450